MTQRSISNTIRAFALGAAVTVAFACESTTEPTTQTSTPLSVYQLVLGTWVQALGRKRVELPPRPITDRSSRGEIGQKTRRPYKKRNHSSPRRSSRRA